MSGANEQDVVIAFRQAVEQEMRRAQDGNHRPEFFAEGASLEQTVRLLAERHAELEQEVALLRTIILRLLSEPVDDQNQG